MIIQNAMQCPGGTIIKSCHRHDFVTHGEHDEYMVDGGCDYIRQSVTPGSTCLNLRDDDDFIVIRKKLLWGTHGIKGDQPLQWVKLIDCESEHLEAIIEHVANIPAIHRRVINSLLRERQR